RAAGVEDVVDQDHGHPLEREVEAGRAHERLRVPRRLAAADVDVVAVEGDVELPERDLRAGELLDALAEPLRERHAAGVDTDERDPAEVGVPLDDLVRDPRQRLRDRVGVEQRGRGRGFGGYRPLRAYLTFDSFSASQDRVKGVVVGAGPYGAGRTLL